MAIKSKKGKAAAKPLSASHKKQFIAQLDAAESGLKTLAASVKKLRAQALAATYVGGAPMTARARRPKRG
jgi:hypothetical protein